MYSLQELEQLLRNEEAKFELINQNKPIRSVKDAEAYYDIEKSAPTFILQSEEGMIACIALGTRGKLDLSEIKRKFGFLKLKMAEGEKIKKQLGYDVGAIPLIGHGLPCIFDNLLLQCDYIYGGTGNELVTLKIDPIDVKRLNQIIGTI